MTTRLLFLSILFVNFSLNSNAGWGDFMGKAVSSIGNAAKSVGSSVGNISKSVGSSALSSARCNMLKNQGMTSHPDYYQQCVQTGYVSSMPGMGNMGGMGGMGGMSSLPYGMMPPVMGGSGVNTTLNGQWSDDPLANAGMGQMQNGMGQMQNGMGQMQGQATGFAGLIGKGLVNSFMGGGQQGYGQQGYGQQGYGQQGYGQGYGQSSYGAGPY